MNKCSTSNIACACSSNQIKDYKTSREILFGWDKFSTIASLVLIIALITWCVIFFLSIENHVVDSENHGGHGDHVDHTGHGGHEDNEDHSNHHVLPLISKFAMTTN
ncbi:uncharacterized protein LOC127282584 [Leptopilina boulardi]|uniref:uncharacterized protein LOC127282584 n=1 Tax=Leptopilina boulardi TaxID=63433 RepID=UPI0021F5AFEF|nr:uncharacterized protein LOC127282584 [Leptopilina boulardi]